MSDPTLNSQSVFGQGNGVFFLGGIVLDVLIGKWVVEVEGVAIWVNIGRPDFGEIGRGVLLGVGG